MTKRDSKILSGMPIGGFSIQKRGPSFSSEGLDRTAQIVKMRLKGDSVKDIAEEIGIARQNVGRHLRKGRSLGPVKKILSYRGDTRKKVLELRATGMIARKIGEKLGIAISAVFRHLREERKGKLGMGAPKQLKFAFMSAGA